MCKADVTNAYEYDIFKDEKDEIYTIQNSKKGLSKIKTFCFIFTTIFKNEMFLQILPVNKHFKPLKTDEDSIENKNRLLAYICKP